MNREEFMEIVYDELYSDGDNYRANRIIDAADEYAETEQEPRWIPVNEKLPEECIAVLVNCPTNKNIFCAYLEKGKWFIFSPIGNEKINELVTAWQPLPSRYEE